MDSSGGTPLVIAHYRITSKLGAGGMGEVYRATDTKLGRDVAIKFLPDALAQIPDRLNRFSREARVLASMNHPNIAAVFGVEERALVMELVEGPTLEERIAQGPIPVPEALAIARQVAEAVEYAHEHGVVHRDLKPANIKVTTDGRVKVLDFGLAKAVSADSTGGDSLTSASVATQTMTGVIMGTPAYMSPEQARGKPADRRSDIWAFGMILVEMLTGKRLPLALLIDSDPDLSKLPADTPAAVKKLIRRCLDRDPQRRLQWIGEARIAIEDGLSGAGDAGAADAAAEPGWKAWGWIAAAAALVACGALALVHFREKPVEAPLVRFTISPPEKTTFTIGGAAVRPPAISPDGRRLLFKATSQEGRDQLWVRSLDSFDARPLAGTENGGYAFWSPDGKSIGFFAEGKLKKIDVAGGPAITLADAANGRGGAWGPDGVILFCADRQGPLMRVSSAGGSATPATKLAQGEVNHRLPWFLPDGRHFLYAAPSTMGSDHVKVYAASLDAPDAKYLLDADSNAEFAGGYLVFLRVDTLMAEPFDPKRLAFTGEAVPVAEKVGHVPTSAAGLFSLSRNGWITYQTGTINGTLKLTWFDRSGKHLSTVGDASAYGRLHFSPDRKSVAIGITEGNNSDIWIFDVARGLRTRFTFDPAMETQAVWSPDGKTIVFDSIRKGHFDLYRKAADGSGSEDLLYADSIDKSPTSWSPDGKYILYNTLDPKTYQDIWALPMAPENRTQGAASAPKPFPFVQTQFNEGNAQFSPDGKWVSYQSNESGRSEIYVAPFPGPGGKRQISSAGGALARWRNDGKEIFYIAPEEKLMAAEVSMKGTSLNVGEVHTLFGPIVTGLGFMYDISVDGQKILTPAAGEQTISEPLTVVQNWTAALKK